MRGRYSRKLGLLAKAGLLLWLLWLGYLLLERASFPSSLSMLEDDEGHELLDRRSLAVEASGIDGLLARPLYTKPSPDSSAPGEWGRATHLTLNSEESKLEQESIERYAINIYVSDKISLHRHIQDNRMHEWVEMESEHFLYFMSVCWRLLLFSTSDSSSLAVFEVVAKTRPPPWLWTLHGAESCAAAVSGINIST